MVALLLSAGGALGASAAGAAGAAISNVDGVAYSRNVSIYPRANSVFAVTVEQYIGASHAALDSTPRAEGYAATYGIPIAQNIRGATSQPVDYGGQCYANFPGQGHVECGLPVSGFAGPATPHGSPVGAAGARATADAAGDPYEIGKLRATGVAATTSLKIVDAIDIASTRSLSRTFSEDGVVKIETTAVARNVTIAGVLYIGTITSVARAVHNGELYEAIAEAHTQIQDASVGGVPVTFGPSGLIVNGTPLKQADGPDAAAVTKALAEKGVTVEEMPPPKSSKDETLNSVDAVTKGLRIRIGSASGDKFDLVLGEAGVRLAASRADTGTGTGGDTNRAVQQQAAVSDRPRLV